MIYLYLHLHTLSPEGDVNVIILGAAYLPLVNENDIAQRNSVIDNQKIS